MSHCKDVVLFDYLINIEDPKHQTSVLVNVVQTSKLNAFAFMSFLFFLSLFTTHLW